jgi:CheY-like chemotaxis protein
LAHFGYNTTTATGGQQAIEKASNDKNIDMVLMDINLGNDMNGSEAAKKILTRRQCPLSGQ